MGVYNPHIPRILGQEFAPIRDEDTTFSPSVNVVELGHSFVTNTARTLTTAEYFVHEFPPGAVAGQVMMASVYPAGLEDKTGPIRRVVIPCNFGAITGSGITIDSPDGRVATALQSPSHFFGVSAQPNLGAGSQKALDIFFNTSAYAQLLQGKRIVAVNLLYQLAWDPVNATNPPATPSIVYTFDQDLTLSTGNSPGLVASMRYCGRDSVYGANLLTLNPPQGRLSATTEVARIQLGEVNHLWSTPSWTITQDKMPWRYEELARFEATAGPNRYRIHWEFGATASVDYAGSYALGYAALEVLFCEEQRLIVGGIGYGLAGNFQPTNFYVLGANPITLRNLSTLATTPSLPAGNWTAVVESPDIGDLDGVFVIGDISRPAAANTYPTLSSLRELYALSSHPGVKINVTQTPGEVFTKESTLILPQIGLMTSTTVIPEIHVYGRQAVAQVWGSITARQEILDSGMQPAAYPQVRYYARRFGATTVPLTLSSPTISGAGLSVNLTPAQWDALDPIIDGWKEITLTFPTAPVMGAGTNPQWVWSATGETAGNRWEVLGAIAPAVSGVPGSYVIQTPPTQQLVTATYGAPTSGAGINLSWISQYAPPVSATADDQTSDAVLLFSQNSPTITGFTIQQLSQPLSGIGFNCGIAPEFVPTALDYNRLCWGLDQGNIASDVFNRTSVSQWGTASSGQLWAAGGGSVTDFNVANGVGTVFLSTTGTYRITKLGNFRIQDVDGYVEIASNQAAGSQDHWGSLFVRDDGTANSNQWYAQVKFNPSGTVQLLLTSVTTATTHTVLGTVTIANSYTLNTKVKVRVQAAGSSFKGKAWMDGEVEPADWQIQASSADNLGGGYVGTRSVAGNGNPTISYSNLLVSSISQGYTELQRQDELTEWQTIMAAYDQSIACFNDYEARTDMASDYRVRYVNVYGFAGPWSSTVSNTIPSPGVTVSGAVENVWMFTTNEQQDGSSNLAYCLGWDGEVSEDFSFPEASGQTFQTMYGRDFVTVFRPLERGGTTFSRNLLVQAAAISPETLEDFHSLRNMAWANVPYICLRDQESNRWFSNVSVPGGNVLRSRRLYMAPVTVVEVTDTASPVNP